MTMTLLLLRLTPDRSKTSVKVIQEAGIPGLGQMDGRWICWLDYFKPLERESQQGCECSKTLKKMFACFDVLQICIMQNIDNTTFLHLWSHAGSNNYILFGGFRLRSHKRSNLLDSPLEISWNGVCDREASLEILKAKLDDISWNRVGMLLHICRWYVIWVYQATSCNRCKGLLTTLYQ